MANKTNFSSGVFKHLNHRLQQDILQAPDTKPNLRKEISRVFQQANRRIQNIESKGVYSPAVSALHKGDITNYSKFSLSGKSWVELKMEYTKAITFLRQPTSTATGAGQYNEHIRKKYDLTKDEYNAMSDHIQGRLTSLSGSAFVEQYLMRYKDFSGEIETEAKSLSHQLESDAVHLTDLLDAEILESAHDALHSKKLTDSEAKNVIDELHRIYKALGIPIKI